jgi:hypothetical protein
LAAQVIDQAAAPRPVALIGGHRCVDHVDAPLGVLVSPLGYALGLEAAFTAIRDGVSGLRSWEAIAVASTAAQKTVLVKEGMLMAGSEVLVIQERVIEKSEECSERLDCRETRVLKECDRSC